MAEQRIITPAFVGSSGPRAIWVVGATPEMTSSFGAPALHDDSLGKVLHASRAEGLLVPGKRLVRDDRVTVEAVHSFAQRVFPRFFGNWLQIQWPRPVDRRI